MTLHSPVIAAPNLSRLRDFVISLAVLVERAPYEVALLKEGRLLLQDLVSVDDWLPAAYAQPHPDHYQQYLLHADSQQRFSVVSFVWGAGQATPIHDHTVWGLVGVLRGAEQVESFRRDAAGDLIPDGPPFLLNVGEVEAVSPSIGDIHRVSNGNTGGVSVSVHVYGANIGAVNRHVFTSAGEVKPFVSGYANTTLPNLWDTTKS
jgi:predicted metal-dependent enzyme (double-stranded beta helix superfamily)